MMPWHCSAQCEYSQTWKRGEVLPTKLAPSASRSTFFTAISCPVAFTVALYTCTQRLQVRQGVHNLRRMGRQDPDNVAARHPYRARAALSDFLMKRIVLS